MLFLNTSCLYILTLKKPPWFIGRYGLQGYKAEWDLIFLAVVPNHHEISPFPILRHCNITKSEKTGPCKLGTSQNE